MGIGFDNDRDPAVAEMGKKLTQISEQLNGLRNQLNEVEQRIENLILKAEYDIRAGQMTDLIGNIDSIRATLNSFINNPIKNNPTLLANSRAEILADIKNKLISNENLIHNQLVGVGSSESLMKIWSRAVQIIRPH